MARLGRSFPVKAHTSTVLIEIPTVDRWFQPFLNPNWNKPHNEHLYPSFTVDSYQLTIPERSTVDKWFRPLSEPIKNFDVKRQQFTYPDLFIAPLGEISSIIIGLLGKWRPNYPDYIFPKLRHYPYTYPFFTVDTLQLTQVERIDLDKWFAPLSEPIKYKDVKRQQYTYPFFVIDTRWRVPDPFDMKWFRELSRPRWDIRHDEWNYPNYFAPDPATTELFFLIGMGPWRPVYPDYIFPKKRSSWTFPWLTWHPRTVREPLTFRAQRPGMIKDNVYIGEIAKQTPKGKIKPLVLKGKLG